MINGVYAVTFFIIAIPAVKAGGLLGIGYAIVGMNLARFIAVTTIGIRSAKGKPLSLD